MKISKKSIDEEYLELYDGQMAKLSDKKLISDVVDTLAYTARGKELFAMSESLYCSWLQGGGDKKLVDDAIYMCRKAVEAGYPHAVLKMAFYYDKDYLDLERTEEFRCRVACDYYCKIAYYDVTPKCEEGVIPEVPWERLQITAAKMLLEMLAGAQRSLAGYSGKYSYAENFKRLHEKYGIGEGVSAAPPRAERDRELFINTVIESCKLNKVRSPLFGVLSLTGEQVKSIFAPRSAAMKLAGDVNLWLYADGKITRANNTSAFNKYVNSFEAEEAWLFFFNNNLGGHRYLSGAQRKDLCEIMRRDDYDRFKKLCDSADERGKSEYLFSDDDVTFFMGGRLTPIRVALDKLIERVISDKEWDEV